jgi:hypothetical protein
MLLITRTCEAVQLGGLVAGGGGSNPALVAGLKQLRETLLKMQKENQKVNVLHVSPYLKYSPHPSARRMSRVSTIVQGKCLQVEADGFGCSCVKVAMHQLIGRGMGYVLLDSFLHALLFPLCRPVCIQACMHASSTFGSLHASVAGGVTFSVVIRRRRQSGRRFNRRCQSWNTRQAF